MDINPRPLPLLSRAVPRRYVVKNVWPILRGDAVPVAEVLAGKKHLTRHGVVLLVAILGGSHKVANSVGRLAPLRSKRLAGDHAPPCDVSDLSTEGQTRVDVFIAWLSLHPSLLVLATRIADSPAAELPAMFAQDAVIAARPYLDVFGGLLARFTTARQFNRKVRSRSDSLDPNPYTLNPNP